MTYFTIPMTPARATSGIRRELDRLFDDAFQPRATTGWVPVADIREDGQSYSVDLELPGVSADSVEVLAEDGVLTIKGERLSRQPHEGERMVVAERSSGAFIRRFRLPKSADATRISAQYADGLLTVRIEKVAPAQPRRVTVQVAQPAVSSTPQPAV
jgi:HSP20 family protein